MNSPAIHEWMVLAGLFDFASTPGAHLRVLQVLAQTYTQLSRYDLSVPQAEVPLCPLEPADLPRARPEGTYEANLLHP